MEGPAFLWRVAEQKCWSAVRLPAKAASCKVLPLAGNAHMGKTSVFISLGLARNGHSCCGDWIALGCRLADGML